MGSVFSPSAVEATLAARCVHFLNEGGKIGTYVRIVHFGGGDKRQFTPPVCVYWTTKECFSRCAGMGHNSSHTSLLAQEAVVFFVEHIYSRRAIGDV